MESLGFQLREEATLATLTQDVIKTSEIEGQKLDTQQVRSSIARRMGIEIGALPPVDRNVEGIVEVMLDATRHYQMLLDQDRLFGWHTDASGPMQVVSGAYGREKVHYEAPRHDRLNAEITRFLAWLNAACNRSGSDLGARAFLVRDDPSIRRRQRAHCPRHLRHNPRTL